MIRSARGLFLAVLPAAAGRGRRGAAGGREQITTEAWHRRTGLTLRFV